jgi:hypothetical protein
MESIFDLSVEIPATREEIFNTLDEYLIPDLTNIVCSFIKKEKQFDLLKYEKKQLRLEKWREKKNNRDLYEVRKFQLQTQKIYYHTNQYASKKYGDILYFSLNLSSLVPSLQVQKLYEIYDITEIEEIESDKYFKYDKFYIKPYTVLEMLKKKPLKNNEIVLDNYLNVYNSKDCILTKEQKSYLLSGYI